MVGLLACSNALLRRQDRAMTIGYVETCLFCRIVAGQEQAHVVYDGQDVMAFLDVRPVFKGHTLVVPRTHLDTLLDLPPELGPAFLSTLQQVAGAMTSALGAQGTFVAVNNVVSQSVPHLHGHVVPRTKGDGLRGFFWPRTRYADGEQEAYADRIRASLDR